MTCCGPLAGKEIIQLYVVPPADGELNRELQSLKGFTCVELQPGESRIVTLRLPVADLACYHPGLNDWVIMPGEYPLRLGKSSRDCQLQTRVTVAVAPRYVPLRADNSLQQLIQQPGPFARVVTLVAEHSQCPESQVRERLIALAPDMFCGLYVALTAFLGLDIDCDTLNAALAEPSLQPQE